MQNCNFLFTASDGLLHKERVLREIVCLLSPNLCFDFKSVVPRFPRCSHEYYLIWLIERSIVLFVFVIIFTDRCFLVAVFIVALLGPTLPISSVIEKWFLFRRIFSVFHCNNYESHGFRRLFSVLHGNNYESPGYDAPRTSLHLTLLSSPVLRR